jgi:thiol-disulfide isomerase/thioredoxin
MWSASVWAENPGDTQADLSFADLQGKQHSLAEYHGKILVVNFWATWCGPCKHEMPLFADAAKKYGQDHLQVVAVSLDDESTRSKIPGFAEKEKMSFPILLGNMDALKTLATSEALPATLFVDAEGNVVARVLGEISKSELKERLDWLLAGKSGKAPAELLNNVNKKKDEVGVPMMH